MRKDGIQLGVGGDGGHSEGTFWSSSTGGSFGVDEDGRHYGEGAKKKDLASTVQTGM